MMKLNRKTKVLLVMLSVLALYIIASYTKVEILTWQHKSEFYSRYDLTGMVDDIEYCKVMSYSKEYAEVYYVTKDKEAGLLYSLILDENGEWQLDSWDAVWSKSGSADDFIWPYYR